MMRDRYSFLAWLMVGLPLAWLASGGQEHSGKAKVRGWDPVSHKEIVGKATAPNKSGGPQKTVERGKKSRTYEKKADVDIARKSTACRTDNCHGNEPGTLKESSAKKKSGSEKQ